MILKFHMQHDKAAGLQQKIKFRLLGNQIWPLLQKIAKPLKSVFLLNHLIYLASFVWSISCTLIFQNYQNKKKSIAELGHNDLLPVYEPYFA